MVKISDLVAAAITDPADVRIGVDQTDLSETRQLSLDALQKAGQLRVVDSIVQLLLVTNPRDGQLFQTKGYTTPGDGGGNTYRYDIASAATVDGGWVINGPSSVGRYLALDRSVANVKQFGAFGDGVVDDVASVEAAMNAAHDADVAAFFPPGTYSLTTISPDTFAGTLRLLGTSSDEVTLVGGPTKGFAVLDDGASCYMTGITFDTWLTVLSLNPNSGSTPYGTIEISECAFNQVVVSPVHCQTGVDVITELRFQRNRCTNAGHISNADICGGIAMNADNILSGFVTDNEIRTVGGPAITGQRFGIYLGGITDDPRSSLVVSGNRIYDVQVADLSNCDGIICYGRSVRIVNNAVNLVKSANNSNVDQEGIYTKASYSVISGNTLINAGGREGCITQKGGVKGDPVTTDAHGNDNVIADNTILIDDGRTIRSTGITSQQEGTWIHDNIIEGTTWGISIDANCVDAKVTNNKIINLLNQAGDVVYGIQLRDPQDVIVDGNLLKNLGTGTQTTCYGIYVINDSGDTTGALEITNNALHDLNSSASSTSRGIYVTPEATSTMTYCKIAGNRVDDVGRGIFLNNCNVITHLRVTNNDVNNCSSSDIVMNAATAATVAGNTIDGSATQTAANADTTPSVAGINALKTNNAGATTITNFDGDVSTQALTVIVDANTTLQHNANMQLNGAANFVPGSGGGVIQLINDGGVWKETGRASF